MVERSILGSGQPPPTAVLVSWRDKGFSQALMNRLRECGLPVTRTVPPDHKDPYNEHGETVAVIVRESSKEKDGRAVAIKKATRLGMNFVLLPPTDERAWEHVFEKGKVPFVWAPAKEAEVDTGKEAAEKRAQEEARERALRAQQENEELRKELRALAEKEVVDAEARARDATAKVAGLKAASETPETLLAEAEEEVRKASEAVRLARAGVDHFVPPEVSSTEDVPETPPEIPEDDPIEEGVDLGPPFGQRLRECRNNEGIGQERLADLLCIPGGNSSVSRDERGGKVSHERYAKYLKRYPSLAQGRLPEFVLELPAEGLAVEPPSSPPSPIEADIPLPVSVEVAPSDSNLADQQKAATTEPPPHFAGAGSDDSPSTDQPKEALPHVEAATEGPVNQVPGLERLVTVALILKRDFSLHIDTEKGIATVVFGTTIQVEGLPGMIVPEARRRLELEIDEVLSRRIRTK